MQNQTFQPSCKMENNCIKAKRTKPNAKQAYEIGRVNRP